MKDGKREKKDMRTAEKTQNRFNSISMNSFTWDTELKWDETTVGVVFIEESTESIILCNAKAMGPKSLNLSRASTIKERKYVEWKEGKFYPGCSRRTISFLPWSPPTFLIFFFLSNTLSNIISDSARLVDAKTEATLEYWQTDDLSQPGSTLTATVTSPSDSAFGDGSIQSS